MEEDIKHAQKKYLSSLPKNSNCQGNEPRKVGNPIWIPEEADNLQLRLLITAHCGTSGHRGAESTEEVLKEQFTWDSIKEDTRDLVLGCINCLMSKTGHKIPRPMSETVHAEKPNDVLHFYFLYMGRDKTITSTSWYSKTTYQATIG